MRPVQSSVNRVVSPIVQAFLISQMVVVFCHFTLLLKQL